MLERMKKRRTEKPLEARFFGSRDKIIKLRDFAKQIGLIEAAETVTIAEAFPGTFTNLLPGD